MHAGKPVPDYLSVQGFLYISLLAHLSIHPRDWRSWTYPQASPIGAVYTSLELKMNLISDKLWYRERLQAPLRMEYLVVRLSCGCPDADDLVTTDMLE